MFRTRGIDGKKATHTRSSSITTHFGFFLPARPIRFKARNIFSCSEGQRRNKLNPHQRSEKRLKLSTSTRKSLPTVATVFAKKVHFPNACKIAKLPIAAFYSINRHGTLITETCATLVDFYVPTPCHFSLAQYWIEMSITNAALNKCVA